MNPAATWCSPQDFSSQVRGYVDKFLSYLKQTLDIKQVCSSKGG